MNKKEDEILEDLIERFMYNAKREKIHYLGYDTLKTLLPRRVRDELIDILNLVSRGNV